MVEECNILISYRFDYFLVMLNLKFNEFKYGKGF